MSDTEKMVAFQAEVMLAGWTENHTAGAKVTFYLGDTSELEFFRALKVKSRGSSGQRFMMVLVEIGDDDKPIDQKAIANAMNKGGAVSRLSAQWCQREDFQHWLKQRYPNRWANALNALSKDNLPNTDDEVAAELVRLSCGVQSRAELDHSKDALDLWERGFRKPFMAVIESSGGDA